MSDQQGWLFVYGTLRPASRHRMARWLAARARWLGAARVPGRLYDLGAYPGLSPSSAAGEWVYGDLYELTEPAELLAELDQYEGPDYERRRVALTGDGGAQGLAWVYVYRGTVAEEWRIASGYYFAR